MPNRAQNIIRGIGSILEICPEQRKIKICRESKKRKSVSESLLTDWTKISSDLWAGIEKAISNHQKDLDITIQKTKQKEYETNEDEDSFINIRVVFKDIKTENKNSQEIFFKTKLAVTKDKNKPLLLWTEDNDNR